MVMAPKSDVDRLEGCAVANCSRWARHDGQENVERAHAVIPFWWLIERELAFGWLRCVIYSLLR